MNSLNCEKYRSASLVKIPLHNINISRWREVCVILTTPSSSNALKTLTQFVPSPRIQIPEYVPLKCGALFLWSQSCFFWVSSFARSHTQHCLSKWIFWWFHSIIDCEIFRSFLQKLGLFKIDHWYWPLTRTFQRLDWLNLNWLSKMVLHASSNS